MRIKNSIRNTVFAMGSQVINIVLNFVSRTIFIWVLGSNYLGINGLFSNILSMLSLAELGIGNAIVYHMYKPLANKDNERLKSLMQLYKKAYIIIGVTVVFIGLSILPFFDYIIKDKPNITDLKLIYILFLINSACSYFFIYKSSLINADQKNYIITIKQQKYAFIQVILQIIFLILTKNYIIYLIVQIICTFLLNFSLSRKADELYPFLKSKKIESLDKKSKKEIFKHVMAMMSHKIGGAVVNGTDNILISSFVGIYWVGLYSNYILITSTINRVINQIFSSITSSVGNLNAIESKEKSYKIYKRLFFMNFWLYGFSSVCLLILMNPFIELWIGNEFILDKKVILVLIINFYISGMRQTTITFNTTLGLFWNDRFKPWAEAAINLFFSILLANKFGLLGILLGTLISTISTSLWVDPYILYKHGFKKSPSLYAKKYFKYSLMIILTCIITYFITSLIVGNGYVNFAIKLLICLFVPNIMFIILNYRKEEYKFFLNIISSIFSRKLKLS
ncbi:lipopolysaccharide biosynthesis protein [Clostridium sp.]|uniref:lipopolysaccharide biosynthesis protein n=1 Tax=Clostridium sp. TaxID=1506 RepID=UPI002906E132|nr:oligosaccharide flippase family protein [Clostridium sp.]MDU3526250.1 oligosaccharide flippase family protein [Clostridium sp.]MDU3548471.1 oligosaccharide flippase family protein [Clostridium sp.]